MPSGLRLKANTFLHQSIENRSLPLVFLLSRILGTCRKLSFKINSRISPDCGRTNTNDLSDYILRPGGIIRESDC